MFVPKGLLKIWQAFSSQKPRLAQYWPFQLKQAAHGALDPSSTSPVFLQACIQN